VCLRCGTDEKRCSELCREGGEMEGRPPGVVPSRADARAQVVVKTPVPRPSIVE
jgi:hypothetical protein